MASELTIGQQIVARLGTRRRSIIKLVRSAIDACERAASTLEQIAVKNS